MTSPIVSQKRGRILAERVVSELAAEIRHGALRPGRPPADGAQAAQRFGVSRTVVREALSRLQASGLVETRHGVGTFVAASRRDVGLRADAAEIGTVVDRLAMLELRIGVESEAAALAARRRAASHLAAMRAALDEFAAHLAARRHVAGGLPLPFGDRRGATGNRVLPDPHGLVRVKAIPRRRLNFRTRAPESAAATSRP